MSSIAGLTLPYYESPPVTETAMSIEMAPVASLGFVELSGFREFWLDGYPGFDELPAIVGGLPLSPQAQEMRVELMQGLPGFRLWLHNNKRGLLLQVQRDRLVLNWRQSEAGDYPRYSALRLEYFTRWEEFATRIQEKKLGTVTPLVVEFDYVNRIFLDPGEGPSDVIKLLGEEPSDMPGESGFVRFQFVRILPSRTAVPNQLVVTGEPQFEDGRSSYLVTLATRVSVPSDADTDVLRMAMDEAHASGTLGFTAMTTPAVQERWGRTE